MLRSLQNTFWLATKEVRSFLSDYVLLALMIFSFTLSIISTAQKHRPGGTQCDRRHRR